MKRRRNLTPHLTAEWQRQFPTRPAKTEFSDELLVLAAVLMRQIDPTGTKPIIEPPMPADGYEPRYTVRSTGKRSRAKE